jgi:5-methylcytosine-specific restriction endonuclease McrA
MAEAPAKAGESLVVIENLELLCGHCNRVKGNRTQEYLMARLVEMGIAA